MQNIDFNTIYELVSPYIGTSGIAFLIIGIIYIFIKYKSVVKKLDNIFGEVASSIKSKFSEMESEALKAFKAALPENLSINIEALTKQEIAAIKEYFISAINENWLKQITTNSELTKAMANALLAIKSIPDSSKKEIAEILKLQEVQTTDKLKVDLLPIELAPIEVVEEPKKTGKISVD